MKLIPLFFSVLFYSSTSLANGIQTPNSIEPKHVYALSTLLSININLIRKRKQKTHIKDALVEINNAQPREVYFQAINLLNKINLLHFETNYIIKENSYQVHQNLSPGAVWDILLVCLSSLEDIKQELGITETPNLPPIIDNKTPSDVYTQLLINIRQVNILLEQIYTPANVFQEITTSLNYIFSLYQQYPELRLQDFPPYVADKTPENVFFKLLECYQIIREIALLSNIKTLELKLKSFSSIKPSDVFDIAVLINSELDFLHNQIKGLSPVHEAVFPGEKQPSQVYQRARFIQIHLLELTNRLLQNQIDRDK